MAELTKVCTRCWLDKPLSKYYRRTAAPDGRQSWCKKCSGEARQQWAEDNRDLLQALHRKTYRRRMSDPERAMAERVRKRDWQRRHRGSHRPRRVREGTPKASPKLSAQPLVGWLRSKPGLRYVDLEIAVSERYLRDLYNGTRMYVRIDAVDRILMAVDDGTRIDDLYPEA